MTNREKELVAKVNDAIKTFKDTLNAAIADSFEDEDDDTDIFDDEAVDKIETEVRQRSKWLAKCIKGLTYNNETNTFTLEI